MRRLALRFSRAGAFAAVLFLMLACAVFAWIVFAANSPGDSGEGGVLLVPFAMPWIAIVPDAWLGAWLALGCVLLNAVIVYLLFGGLRTNAD